MLDRYGWLFPSAEAALADATYAASNVVPIGSSGGDGEPVAATG